MLKYCLKKWNENCGLLKERLSKKTDLDGLTYGELVKMMVECVLNPKHGSFDDYSPEWDSKHITAVDDGDYQGTLLFLIPKLCCQPAEYEYLMTYASYGSCSGCDALLDIQACGCDIKDLMGLCRDLVCNIIKPYNCGWRNDSEFEPIEEENTEDGKL